MELILRHEEIPLLHRILKQHLPELRAEVVRTENYGWRQDLKRDEATLKAIIARLEQAIDDDESPEPAERLVEQPQEI